MRLTKIGSVALKEHGYIPEMTSEQILFASVSWYAGKFWLSVTGECDRPDSTAARGAVAIGYDCDAHKILVNGETVDVPRKTQHETRHTVLLQRRIARRTEGSGGYWAARRLHQTWERRVAERRSQFLHNLSTRLVQENDEITVLRPPLKSMAQGENAEENSALLANAAGEFFRMLEYKSNWHGRTYTEIGCPDATD